jgi:hypothetical protein
MEEKRNAYRILVGKREGKRRLEKPKRRWVDNIEIDLREIGWDGMDWIDLAQDRDQWRALVNTVMTGSSYITYLHIRSLLVVFSVLPSSQLTLVNVCRFMGYDTM